MLAEHFRELVVEIADFSLARQLAKRWCREHAALNPTRRAGDGARLDAGFRVGPAVAELELGRKLEYAAELEFRIDTAANGP